MYSWSKKDPQSNAKIDAKMKDNHTNVDWYLYCREMCALVMSNEMQVRIGGPGKVVEIDESKFDKRKYHRGRKVLG